MNPKNPLKASLVGLVVVVSLVSGSTAWSRTKAEAEALRKERRPVADTIVKGLTALCAEIDGWKIQDWRDLTSVKPRVDKKADVDMPFPDPKGEHKYRVMLHGTQNETGLKQDCRTLIHSECGVSKTAPALSCLADEDAKLQNIPPKTKDEKEAGSNPIWDNLLGENEGIGPLFLAFQGTDAGTTKSTNPENYMALRDKKKHKAVKILMEAAWDHLHTHAIGDGTLKSAFKYLEKKQ